MALSLELLAASHWTLKSILNCLPDSKEKTACTEILSNMEDAIRDLSTVNPQSPPPVPPMKFNYTNWRGEFGHRSIIPQELFYGVTEYHDKPGWLIRGWDEDKKAMRDFSISGIGHPAPVPGLKNYVSSDNGSLTFKEYVEKTYTGKRSRHFIQTLVMCQKRDLFDEAGNYVSTDYVVIESAKG